MLSGIRISPKKTETRQISGVYERNRLGTMSGFAGRVRFRSSKCDPHLRQCYQGLEQWNCETGQNHRRFGGVEPGTLFLTLLGWCKELRQSVFGGDSLGGNGPLTSA